VRSAGLALDRLVRAEVITAYGRRLTASASEHPDLFWGLRGGGGNFGVVTSFTYEAVPLLDPVPGPSPFSRPAPWARPLAAVERWSRDLPDPLTSILTVMVMPPELGMGEEPWLLVRCAWVGEDEARGRALLERLVRAAPPERSEIGPVSWTQ